MRWAYLPAFIVGAVLVAVLWRAWWRSRLKETVIDPYCDHKVYTPYGRCCDWCQENNDHVHAFDARYPNGIMVDDEGNLFQAYQSRCVCAGGPTTTMWWTEPPIYEAKGGLRLKVSQIDQSPR
jgi:hypothetical protein